MKGLDVFTGKAFNYAKYRPRYPQAFITYVLEKNRLNQENVIADIGAGTGILSEQFLEQGYPVICVEPNTQMRNLCARYIKDYKKATIKAGTAEQTGLGVASVDLIIVAQAFQYFDAKAFRLECQKVLKLGRPVVLAWNTKQRHCGFYKDYEAVCKQFCPNYKEENGKIGSQQYEQFFKDGLYEERVFDNPLHLNLEQYLGYVLSSSYALTSKDEWYQAYVEALIDLFQAYAQKGHLGIPNKTYSYMGEI